MLSNTVFNPAGRLLLRLSLYIIVLTLKQLRGFFCRLFATGSRLCLSSLQNEAINTVHGSGCGSDPIAPSLQSKLVSKLRAVFLPSFGRWRNNFW
jgi:hypothetical protein